MGIVSSTRIQVRYRETDQMAVAWHGNYIEWFEIGRLDWWREQGLSYKEIENRGILLPVLKVTCDYHLAAHFDEVLLVQVRLVEYNGFRMIFSYTITRPDGDALIASGQTEHVATDRAMHPVRLNRKLPDVHAVLQLAKD